MTTLGLTVLDVAGYWTGGRYYLQHLVRCIAGRLRVIDLYWPELPPSDPFAEVRHLLDGRRAIRFPESMGGRLARKAKRLARGIDDARDLFGDIDVTFPLPLIANQGIPYIFWLPDFQHEHLRALYTPEHYESTRALYERNVAGARRIVVSSEFGREDFGRFFPEQLARADVLRFCSVTDDDWWRVDPATAGIDEPYFVVSNQFTEHKNHLAIVEAVRIARDRGTRLHVVCTGSDYDFRGMRYFDRVQEAVRAHGLEEQIRFLGLLPRPEQIAVLRRSVAVLQPSRFEGWSTVIEDAKSIGKYVIASAFPVHREQLAGRPSRFVGMDDVEEWARAMTDTLAARTPGPHRDEEEAAQPLLHAAMKDCGETFVRIVRDATAF